MTRSIWIDGGYKAGERVKVDGIRYVLTVSLGSLGWMAKEVKTGKQAILLFVDDSIN